MGCFPFANSCLQMGVTVMGFAEDFGHALPKTFLADIGKCVPCTCLLKCIVLKIEMSPKILPFLSPIQLIVECNGLNLFPDSRLGFYEKFSLPAEKTFF